MKVAIVPAQITTVEDKVAGSLSLTQLLLLSAPVFGGSAVYILFPPNMGSSPFKIVLITVMTVMFSLFAVRIKGKILLQWLIILLRYSLRPRYFVFDKNDLHLRPVMPKAEPKKTTVEAPVVKKPKHIKIPQLSTADLVQLEHIITNPQAKLRFKTNKKGGLNVHINEIK